MPPRARRAARPLERAATPGAEKKQAGKPKAGAQFDGSRPRTGRVLTRPRRSSRSGRCLWPGAPPACRTRTFRLTTSVPTRSHARSTDPSSNQKESVRPFAQRSSRLKFRAPRPDRRARSCRDASVSVNPPRVRLYVKGCGMSEAELGRIPKVVRGALPRKAGECPHAACRTSNASAKSSNARVIYLLRQTASADRAKRIFARCAPSRWLASTLTRRALSPVPSSPSLHGAPRLGRLIEPTGAPPFLFKEEWEKRAIDTCVAAQENRFSGRLNPMRLSHRISPIGDKAHPPASDEPPLRGRKFIGRNETLKRWFKAQKGISESWRTTLSASAGNGITWPGIVSGPFSGIFHKTPRVGRDPEPIRLRVISVVSGYITVA